MLKIKGNPLAKIAETAVKCFEDFDTPDHCDDCRQLRRWSRKMLAWKRDDGGVFTALVNAIFKADDDILKALCGSCFLIPEDEQSCECRCAAYQNMGLPMRIPLSLQPYCGYIFKEVQIESCNPLPCFSDCFDPSCFVGETFIGNWLKECFVCSACSYRDLDPCANPDDLALMERLIALERLKNRAAWTGGTLIEALEILFPGSMPMIVSAGNGEICVWIGRDMTTEEWQLREFFKTLLPLSQYVTLNFLFKP